MFLPSLFLFDATRHSHQRRLDALQLEHGMSQTNALCPLGELRCSQVPYTLKILDQSNEAVDQFLPRVSVQRCLENSYKLFGQLMLPLEYLDPRATPNPIYTAPRPQAE